MDIDLLPIVERAGCKYFAENDTGDGAIINLALRSPFIRLYALNRRVKILEGQRRRFADNERIQLFAWTHEGCWTELVKLVPMDQPSVFWLHATENVGTALLTIGRLRPARQDVVLFEVGGLRGILQMAEHHFSRTHSLQILVGTLLGPMVWGEAHAHPSVDTTYMLLPNGI